MRITVSNAVEVPHDLVRALVRYGFDELNGRDVEVHVKAARPRVDWIMLCRNPDCRRNYADSDGNRGHWYGTRKAALSACKTPAEAHKVVTPRLRNFSGSAYPSLPGVARVAPDTRWLVTLVIPTRPQDATYPYTWSYHTRAKTAGDIELHSWQEHLVHLAAHEHRHVVQFARDLPKSEVDAETYAHSVIRRFRQERNRDWEASA